MPPNRIALLLLAGMAAAWPAAGQVAWNGRVVDQNDAPVAGARVRLRQDKPAGQAALETVSSPAGSFSIAVPAAGPYLVTVDRAGYFQLHDQPVEISPGGAEATLVLNVQEEVFQSIHVGALPSPVDAAETTGEQRLSGTEINDIPYPATESLRNGMRLIPGTIEDPSAGLHFHGAAEYQTQYTLERRRDHRPHRRPLRHAAGGRWRAIDESGRRARERPVRPRIGRHAGHPQR